MDNAFVVALVVLAITFVVKMPVGVGMIISSAAYFAVAGADLGMVCEIICGKIAGNYIVLAVPLFIFAANIMNEGKITDKIFEFALGLVGRWRGGLGHVNVVASLIFSGMTGAAVADASGLGVMEINAMNKEGYDPPFSAAITAASAVIGPIFPPSIPFIMYALIANVSVGKLFFAGMVPGVMLAVALCIYIAYIAKKRAYPRGPKYTLKQFALITLKALPALATPVILLLGIYTGVMTATEAGGVAAFYGILVASIVYKALPFSEFKRVVVSSLKSAGEVGLVLAGAYSFSTAVAMSGIAVTAGNFVMSVSNSPFVFLLMVNIVLLLFGMILDTNVTILVMVPILYPIAQMFGIDLVHFGVIFVLNCMIGLCTPPYGTLLFIVTGISKQKTGAVVKEILPMVLVMLVVLLFITYVPDSIMWLPNLVD